jgi:hypothetical protein
MRLRPRLILALPLALLLVPEWAEACAVCFGAQDSPMTVGMNNGILTLLGFIGAVQVGFIALFVGFWRRSRRARQLESGLELLQQGGVE